MENNNTSRRDLGQIQKLAWDEKHKANRVISVGETEVKFNLSHKDGDTIASVSASRTLSPGKHDCDDLQKIQAYAAGTVTLFASPDTKIIISLNAGEIVEICAMSLECTMTLVGR